MGQEEGKRSHFLVLWELGHTGCPRSSGHPDEGGGEREQDHENGPELIESRQTGGRSLFSSGVRWSGRHPALGPAAGGGHGPTGLLPSCHRRKFCPPSSPSPTGGAKFTRMIQQQLLILQPPASVPAPHLEAVGVTPPEPGTLFNDMSGQNVAAPHEEARGWRRFQPGARLGCALAFI